MPIEIDPMTGAPIVTNEPSTTGGPSSFTVTNSPTTDPFTDKSPDPLVEPESPVETELELVEVEVVELTQAQKETALKQILKDVGADSASQVSGFARIKEVLGWD